MAMTGQKLALTLAIGFCLALAGCSDKSDGGPISGDEDAEDGGAAGPGGQSGGSNGASTTGTGDIPSEEPTVGTCDVESDAAVAVSARGVCAFTEAAANPANYRSALIEMTWDSLEPGVAEVQLSVETDACNQGGTNDCSVAATQGTSAPMNLTLTAAQLEAHAADNMAAWGAVYGAAVGQKLTIYISLFETETIPPGYTAIP